jgi:hypothetical protein
MKTSFIIKVIFILTIISIVHLTTYLETIFYDSLDCKKGTEYLQYVDEENKFNNKTNSFCDGRCEIRYERYSQRTLCKITRTPEIIFQSGFNLRGVFYKPNCKASPNGGVRQFSARKINKCITAGIGNQIITCNGRNITNSIFQFERSFVCTRETDKIIMTQHQCRRRDDVFEINDCY